jgi:GNAT superfamily N-acetyltransferase
MEIERLNRTDAGRLREIRLRALEDSPDAFGSTLSDQVHDPLQTWAESLDRLATFVAVLDGKDVGLVRAGPDAAEKSRAWLLSMWVAPEGRGQGIGDALVDTVVHWARKEGYLQVALDVGDTNLNAIALYERKGFRPTGHRGAFRPPRHHIAQHRRVLDL